MDKIKRGWLVNPNVEEVDQPAKIQDYQKWHPYGQENDLA